MLSFQTPHHLVVLFIAALITQLALTQGTNIDCVSGYILNGDKKTSTCLDKQSTPWSCPITKCHRDGQPWVPMKGCLHNSVRGSGPSNQQCSEYNDHSDLTYACKNPGGQLYSCSAKPSEVLYLTCSDCVKPKQSAAPSTGA